MMDFASLTEDLAVALRGYRLRKHLTQEELAKKLRVSPRSLQGYEAGQAFPRAKTRRRIARLLEQEKTT